MITKGFFFFSIQEWIDIEEKMRNEFELSNFESVHIAFSYH